MALGMLGFLARRNLIVMFLSVEMMLQGTALDPRRPSADTTATGRGRVFTIIILTVAACEGGHRIGPDPRSCTIAASSLDVTLWQDLREPGLPPVESSAPTSRPSRPRPSRGPRRIRTS